MASFKGSLCRTETSDIYHNGAPESTFKSGWKSAKTAFPDGLRTRNAGVPDAEQVVNFECGP
jgi:hypothetical protein